MKTGGLPDECQTTMTGQTRNIRFSSELSTNMARLIQCQDGCQETWLCYQQLCDPGQIPPSEPHCYQLSNKRIQPFNGFSSPSLLLNCLKKIKVGLL